MKKKLIKKKLITKCQNGEKIRDLNSQLLVQQAGPRGVVDTYDNGVVQLNLPTIEVRPEGVELNDQDKYKQSYENLIYTLRSKGYNNLADNIQQVGQTQGIGNALYHYQDIINRRSELLKSKGAHWDENEAKRMGVAAMSAPYVTLGAIGASKFAGKMLGNIITNPIGFATDMAIGVGMSKLANKISEIRTGKDIYERAQERHPDDPVKAHLSGMLRDPGTYIGLNTILRGKNAYKLSKNLIEAGGIKNYRIAKAITNRLDETIPQFHSEIPSPKIIQSNPTVEEIPNDLFNQAKFELAKRNARPSKLSLAERLGVPKAERNLRQRHPNYGTVTEVPDNVYIINRTSEPLDFSQGKLVWKYPKVYAEDGHKRFTNHWSFHEPVGDHTSGAWSLAPTTILYPYKQAVWDNGFPINADIMDTYWANPNYFTLQGDKVKILTSDLDQYKILKKQGIDVEFSKEGSDMLSRIKQNPKLRNELTTQHAKIHEDWVKNYTKDTDLNFYNELNEEIYKDAIYPNNKPHIVSKVVHYSPSWGYSYETAPKTHSGTVYASRHHIGNLEQNLRNGIPFFKHELPTLQKMNREGLFAEIPSYAKFKQHIRNLTGINKFRLRDVFNGQRFYDNMTSEDLLEIQKFLDFRKNLSTYPEEIQVLFKKQTGGKLISQKHD